MKFIMFRLYAFDPHDDNALESLVDFSHDPVAIEVKALQCALYAAQHHHDRAYRIEAVCEGAEVPLEVLEHYYSDKGKVSIARSTRNGIDLSIRTYTDRALGITSKDL